MLRLRQAHLQLLGRIFGSKEIGAMELGVIQPLFSWASSPKHRFEAPPLEIAAVSRKMNGFTREVSIAEGSLESNHSLIDDVPVQGDCF